jgi:hypothetical protein
MGWGQLIANLAVQGTVGAIKMGIEATAKSRAEQETRVRLKQMQEDNQQYRMLKIENTIISDSNNLRQLTGEKRLLLEGEVTPVTKQLALPLVSSSVQRNYCNMVISGGTIYNRALALQKTCEDAYANGLPTIIVHCGAHEIEQKIANSSFLHNKLIINSGNGLYDPFLSLSETEITNLFFQSSSDYAKQNFNFQALVGLIAELYHIRQNKSLTLKALLKTKVLDLPTKILDSRNKGLIDDTKMLELNQRYQYVQNDSNNFQQYLNQLRSKFEEFYKNSNGKYKGLGKALHGNTIVTLDITDTGNEEFIKLLINNFLLLRRKGVDFIACFVDLNISGYGDAIYNYIVNGNTKFTICSGDIISSVGTTDKFNTVLGLAKSYVYFNHQTGNHCNTLSESLGTYRRWNITYTHSITNRGLIPDVSTGSNVSVNPSEKRVPPEVLQSLSGNQMVFKDGESNEIFLMNLT